MSTTVPNSPLKKHLKEILLLFSVPVGVIAIIIAFLYVPRLFANPAYDFIYCEGYSCESRYSVGSHGRLIVSNETNRYSYNSDRLYYYDLERDATRPIQAADASGYLLDPTSKSPDGYLLQQNTNSGGFLFWGSYNRSWSLKKDFAAKPVTLEGRDINFIGWVQQNG